MGYGTISMLAPPYFLAIVVVVRIAAAAPAPPTRVPSSTPTALAAIVAAEGAAHAWPLDELHCTGCDPAFVEDVGTATPRAHGILINDVIRRETGGAKINGQGKDDGSDWDGFISFDPISMRSGAFSTCMKIRFDAAGPSFANTKRPS